MTLAGLMAPQVKPEGSGVSVRATGLAKPPDEVRVIVDTADWVTSTAAGEEALIPKVTCGPKVKTAVAERVRIPSVPDIGRLKVP